MQAADLRDGFRLGDWLVEPRESRIAGRGSTRSLTRDQLALLLCLAERHGEAVEPRVLAERAWPDEAADESRLDRAIRSLRELLGGDADDASYIVHAGRGGYALIAHFEPAAASREAPPGAVDAGHGALGRLQSLVAELRRRNVFKVVGAYLVGMWIVLQVAETTFEPLRLPGWWMTALTILTVLGLPIVVALAWSYEITPGGIVLDDGGVAGVRMPRARRAVAPIAVAGVALMAGITGIAWWRTLHTDGEVLPAAPPEAGAPSVAVLPFVDMSPGGDSAFLGDGLSEELSVRLAQIPGLRVAARTSAFEFRDRGLDIRRIGQSLGVRHVLEGSVRREGDKLRVTAQLIDAASGYHVWAASYDRDWRDVIDIQDEIARAVTEVLRVVLVPGPSTAGTPPSPDIRAFEPYLAGLALLRQSGDLSRFRQAEQRFADAVAIDPSFARAHAGLCEVRARQFERTRDRDELDRAEQACRRALELDPSLVETEKALASVYVSSGRLADATALYRGLVARNPGDADGHIGLGRALAASGDPAAAERSYRTAVQVEPAFWGAYNSLGSFLFARGRFGEAADAFREVTELAPSSANAFGNLGAALQMTGDLPAAAEAFARSIEIEPTRGAYSNLGTVHYFLGDYAAAAASYRRAIELAAQDQALWGNLADATWRMPDRREEALGHYRRAIELAKRELALRPGDAVLLAQLGYYSGRVGDFEASRRYLERAAMQGDDVHVRYYEAMAAADRGDVAAAKAGAQAAMRLGYPRALLRADPSLRGLGLDPAEGG